ncbi:MAG: hypothetical protein PVF95_13815 [bacterium]
MENRKSRRISILLSMAAALAFWAVNALAVGPRLEAPGGPGGLHAFLFNISIGVTFITGVTTAVMAFTLVMGRGMVLGRDALAGVCRRTIVVPFGLGVGALLAGAVVSAIGLGMWWGPGWVGVLRVYGPSLMPVGIGFALMGSLVGNLAGSVTLDSRDLGRITRVNLVLLISTAAFWLFLMWAVLHLIREGIDSAIL